MPCFVRHFKASVCVSFVWTLLAVYTVTVPLALAAPHYVGLFEFERLLWCLHARVRPQLPSCVVEERIFNWFNNKT